MNDVAPAVKETASVITASSQALRSLQPQQQPTQPGAPMQPGQQQSDGFDLAQIERVIGTVERLMNGPVGQIVIQAYKRKANPQGEENDMFGTPPPATPQAPPTQPGQPQPQAPPANPRQQCDGFLFGLRVVSDEEFKAKVLAQVNELHTVIARHTAKQLKQKAAMVLQQGDDHLLQQLQGVLQIIAAQPEPEQPAPGQNGKKGE